MIADSPSSPSSVVEASSPGSLTRLDSDSTLVACARLSPASDAANSTRTVLCDTPKLASWFSSSSSSCLHSSSAVGHTAPTTIHHPAEPKTAKDAALACSVDCSTACAVLQTGCNSARPHKRPRQHGYSWDIAVRGVIVMLHHKCFTLRDRSILALVCRALKMAWPLEKARIDRWCTSWQLQAFIAAQPQLQHLDLHCMLQPHDISALCQLKKLQVLRVVACRLVDFKSMLQLSHLTSLQHVEVHCLGQHWHRGRCRKLAAMEDVACLAGLPQLRVLHLSCLFNSFTDARLWAAAAQLPSAVSLHVRLAACGQDKDGGAAIVGHLQQLPRLHSLHLSPCFKPDHRLLERLSHMSWLRALNLSSCSRVDERALRHIACLEQLRHLSLAHCNCLNEACMPHLARLTHLSHLDLLSDKQHMPGSALSHMAPLQQLQHLNLQGWRGLGLEAAQHLAALTNLRHLVLCAAQVLHSGLFAQLASNLQRLTHLDVSRCYPPDQAAALEPLAVLPALRCLDLSSWELPGPGALALVGRLGGRLATLKLRYCEHVGGPGLACLPPSLAPCLQHLDLSYCQAVNAEALAQVAQLSALTRLDLAYCGQVGADGMPHLASLPRLLHLNLQRCNGDSDVAHLNPGGVSLCAGITAAALRHLAAAAPQLQRLNVSGNAGVDAVGLWYIGQLLHLQHLDLSECVHVDTLGMSHLSSLKQLCSLCLKRCSRLDEPLMLRLAWPDTLQALTTSDSYPEEHEDLLDF